MLRNITAITLQCSCREMARSAKAKVPVHGSLGGADSNAKTQNRVESLFPCTGTRDCVFFVSSERHTQRRQDYSQNDRRSIHGGWFCQNQLWRRSLWLCFFRPEERDIIDIQFQLRPGGCNVQQPLPRRRPMFSSTGSRRRFLRSHSPLRLVGCTHYEIGIFLPEASIPKAPE